VRPVLTTFIVHIDGFITRNPQIATAGRMGGSVCLRAYSELQCVRGRCGPYFGQLYDGLRSLSVCPSAGATSMHLASDYIHPYRSSGGRPSRCRIRIYLPDDMRDAPVVICSDLPNNPGDSIIYSAELIAAGVIRATRDPPSKSANLRPLEITR
jgi:hypothetical protein